MLKTRYHCDICDINFSCTRKLYSHQVSAEHKKQRELNNNNAQSTDQQLSNSDTEGVDEVMGRAEGGGIETDSTEDRSSSVSDESTDGHNTFSSDTSGPSTSMAVNRASRPPATGPSNYMAVNRASRPPEAGPSNSMAVNRASQSPEPGPSTSMAINRASRPPKRFTTESGFRRRDSSSKLNFSSLDYRQKHTMERIPSSSGASGGKPLVRTASAVPQNGRSPNDSPSMNQPAAASGSQLGMRQNCVAGTASLEPGQEVLPTAAKRFQRARSIQRQIHPSNVPHPRNPGASASMNQEPEQSAKQENSSLHRDPLRLFLRRVKRSPKHSQTKEVKRKHQKVEPEKNTGHDANMVSTPSSPKRVEGAAACQLYGGGVPVVSSSSSAMAANTKSKAAVPTASGSGRNGYSHVAALPCNSSGKNAFKATPQNTNSNCAKSLNFIQRFKKRSEESGSSLNHPFKPGHLVTASTKSTHTGGNQKLASGAAASATRFGSVVASKSSPAASPAEARAVPGNAFAQKKTNKPPNSFTAIQPSGKNGNEAQSSRKGNSSKPPPGVVVPSTSSETGKLPSKKNPVASTSSAALGGVVATTAAAQIPSKTGGIGGKAPSQKNNSKLTNRFNPIQGTSRNDTNVPTTFKNMKPTKCTPAGVAHRFPATDSGSQEVARNSTEAEATTVLKRAALPRKTKSKKVDRLSAKQLREYIPKMPGKSYKMPSLKAVSTFTTGEGIKMWDCLVCSESEPMKSSKPMVSCELCADWYHMKCVGIKAAMPKENPWYCKRCICRSRRKRKYKK